MAKAAEDAVRLNQIQTALGVAGAILLFVTMYYTRSAAKAADDAARAARDQLHVMKVGQRPWVAYRVDLTPLSVGTIFKARTEMTNVGHSPALDVRTLILAKGVKKGNPEPQPFFEFPPQHIHVIASSGVLLPGPPITAWTSFGGGRQPVNETDAAAVTSGALVLWLVGRVEYTDTDGNRYFTMFRGIYDPALSAFVAAGVGNDAR